MIFEKIRERLQKLCEQTYYNSVNGNRDEGIRNNAYHNAIDIINQVETEYNEEIHDDVCEWSYDKNFEFAKSECGFMDTHRIEFVKLKYCPYCGKRIKVVG